MSGLRWGRSRRRHYADVAQVTDQPSQRFGGGPQRSALRSNNGEELLDHVCAEVADTQPSLLKKAAQFPGQRHLHGCRTPRVAERIQRFPDIGVGFGGTRRGLVRSAYRGRVLQGLAQSSDDRGDVPRADMAASAGARRADRRHPHEVALDQLQCVQGREQPRGTLETLQSAHGTNA